LKHPYLTRRSSKFEKHLKLAKKYPQLQWWPLKLHETTPLKLETKHSQLQRRPSKLGTRHSKLEMKHSKLEMRHLRPY
jgi:hypothetical protein